MRRLVDLIGTGRSDHVARPAIPEGLAVFAVGDVHGCVDLLVEMHREIIKQAKALPENLKRVVVYLGDYIDRGPDSADVIDLLVAAPLPGFKSIHLLGNHEHAFIRFVRGERDFLNSPKVVQWLFREGGLATLKSYGVTVSSNTFPENIQRMRVQLLRKMPTDHFEFLQRLTLNHSIGDYFFVHAGIDPTRSLSEQRPSDLLNIREPFLASKELYDKVIVHGHTPYKAPNIQSNRIGLDTEAEASGRLSGLLLQRDNLKLLQVKHT